jgi:hypothetical protein
LYGERKGKERNGKDELARAGEAERKKTEEKRKVE